MKTQKIKIIIILFIALILFCSLCLLIRSYLAADSYSKVIKINWGIELPTDEEHLLYQYSEPSPHGDGIRYHVIGYPVGDESTQTQNTVFQLEKIFSGTAQPTADQIEYVEQLLTRTDTEAEYIPDWTRCRLVYMKQQDNSELFYSIAATPVRSTQLNRLFNPPDPPKYSKVRNRDMEQTL